MMKGKIRITLKSDLCAGSGYSYAGIIDSDTVYDRYGLPYIPAKRLKGCLRETAEMIGMKTDMFGMRGQDSSPQQETAFTIYDAVIADHRKISDEIAASTLSVEDVLEAYTSVRAQTSIDENGVANDKSLRFTRVVNKNDPLKERQELVFEAPVAFEETYQEQVRRLAKSLRHIGMNRNRGLGSVACEFIAQKPDGENAAAECPLIDTKEIAGLGDDAAVTLKYTIRTDAPVMVSTNSDTVSESYINGQSVLGFFAGCYLRDGNHRADDERFEQMFLKGGLQFTPLYPSDMDGSIYYPAPSYINKLKKTAKYVNTSIKPEAYKENGEEYDPGNGNQPKKLKGKYVSLDGGGVKEKEVDTEIIYHNRHESDGMDRQLYASQAISGGQYFSGSITGKKEDVLVMVKILQNHDLTFGKSRKAQYGKCGLVSAKAEEKKKEPFCAKSGSRVLVTLLSDGIFIDPDGNNYTVRTDIVRSAIEKALGIETKTVTDAEKVDEPYGEIEVKEISGYYGVWNMRKQSVPVVAAGSTFEFILQEDVEITTVCVGERNGEGFGAVALKNNGGVEEIRHWNTHCESQSADRESRPKDTFDKFLLIEPLIRMKRMADCRNELMAKSIKAEPEGVKKAVVGRLALMLGECVYECARANDKDLSGVREALEARIDSIKDIDKKKQAKDIFVKYFHINEKDVSEYGSLSEREKAELQVYCLNQALITLKYKLK